MSRRVIGGRPEVEALRSYQRKAKPDEVLVVAALGPSASVRRDAQELTLGLQQAGNRFGFHGVATSPPAAPVPRTLITHLQLIEDAPFSEAIAGRAADALASWGSVSLAFAYPSRDDMLSAEAPIDAWKRRAGPNLNFLFPDECRDGWHVVSNAKIVDNAVCDTVRVKYQPHQIADRVELSHAAWHYFRAASRLYGRERLFLRAPTDGYIAMRHRDGFLITATRTSKLDLDPLRVSLVHGYDEATGTLTYSGHYLPSSDAVEAAIVLAAMPDVSLLLHTHASRLFTRNPQWSDRVRVAQLPYGEPALGRALVEALVTVGDGFVIMAEHGEVFAGAGDTDRFLAGIAGHCAVARRGRVHG